MAARIRVLIVDDHAMVRRGMRDFLALHDDLGAELKARHPAIEVVAITSFIEEDRITAAIEAGASGFLLKDAEADDLAGAIRAAHAGEVYLDPAVAGIVARRMRAGAGRLPHVSNILAKLGLTSRTQAALFAVEHKSGENT